MESTLDSNSLPCFPHDPVELTPWLCIKAFFLGFPLCPAAILSPKLYQFFAPLETC